MTSATLGKGKLFAWPGARGCCHMVRRAREIGLLGQAAGLPYATGG